MPKIRPSSSPSPQTPSGPSSSRSEGRTVRHSELADFRQCPLKWWLKWVNRWQLREGGEPASLGTAWHEVMAHHYRQIQHWQFRDRVPEPVQIGAAVEPIVEYFRGTSHYDKLVWMYDGYLQKWGVDLDWLVLDFEKTQTVEMAPGLFYEWTTDVLVRDRTLGKVRVVDHKSTSNALRQSSVDLSDQLGLYVMASNRLGYKVADGVVSQARTEKLVRHMTLDERYQRIPSYRSPIELENIWADAAETIQMMVGYMEDPGRTPYSAPDPRVCSWKCDYREAHLILRKTRRELWDQKLEPLLESKGFEQREVPRGSERIV